MSKRHCPDCGNEITGDTMFCVYCGAVLGAPLQFDDNMTRHVQDDRLSVESQLGIDDASRQQEAGWESFDTVDVMPDEPLHGTNDTPVQSRAGWERTDTIGVSDAGFGGKVDPRYNGMGETSHKGHGALIAALATLLLFGAGAILFLRGGVGIPHALKTFTVSYETGGGDRIEAQKVDEGEQVFTPTDPKREGYTFAGWYTSSDYVEVVTFPFEATEDVVLYAKWDKPTEGGSPSSGGSSTGAEPAPTNTTQPQPQTTAATPADSSVQSQGYVGMTSAWATSTYPIDEDDPGPYDAYCVLDGKPETAWVEGAGGNGVGESITLTGPMQTISGFSIRPGYHKISPAGRDQYYQNARPAKIHVMANGEVIHQQTLADAGHTSQDVVFAQPIQTDALTIVIDSVYPGEHDDCAISEISCF